MAREDGGIMTDLSDKLPDGNYIASNWSKPTPISDQRKQPLFGPGMPVLPSNPLDKPRIFQYRPGINLTIIPRYGYGLADFPLLRNLSIACKEVRLNIELIKREVRSLEWEIVPTKESDKTDYTKDIAEIEAFFDNPDGAEMDFDSWINALLEEVMVTDALSLYPNFGAESRLMALDLIDGTTIRPVLDYRGKIAKPPAPGYLQVLYGMPAIPLTTSELIYRPMNASVNSPYGTSPIEFIMMMVNLALRRDTYHVANYTEGNVPEALIGAPATWDQGAIDTWQTYWDALLAGNTKQQRRIHWVPLEGGRSSLPVYEFHKDNQDTTVQDEWLMKVACWAFGNSPTEFGLVSGGGLGGAGFMSSMADIHSRSMITPVTQYIERILSRIVKVQMAKPWLKFKWTGLDPSEDTLKQAQVDQINIDLGVYDREYVQDRDGIPQERRPAQVPAPADDTEPLPGEEPGIAKFFRGESYP